MTLFGLGKPKQTVGLDVGSGLVKVAVVDHSKDYPRLDKVAVRPLLPDAIVEGEIMDPGLVSDTLRSLFAEEEIAARNVVTSVGGRDVIIKSVQMDRMDKSAAREVIRWEAEQHVPFDMDSVQLDFEVTDPEGEGLQMNVLLVAAKRELVDNRIALLQEANLNPTIVDVDAFALHNALEVNYPAAMMGITGLVSIGHDSTTVNILDDGIPVLTRDLTFGTRRLTVDLQRERGMTEDQADAALRGDADAELRSFLFERSQDIARGVERAAAFLETREFGATLSRLYLCGGGVHVPGLAEALAERLGIETVIASAVEEIQVKPETLDYIESAELSPLLMLSVGLALRRAA